MKFSAEKAGKKARCPKCQTINVVKGSDEDEAQKKEKSTAIEPAPEAAPQAASPAPAPGSDDDAGGAYEVFLDPELEELRKKQAAEEEEAAKKKKKEKKALPTVARKVKAIPDAELWARVRLGLLFLFIGTIIWGACHLLQGSYVALGRIEFPEYAQLVAATMEFRGNDGLPERGRWWDIDELSMYLGMIAGRDILGYAKACLTLAAILYIFHAGFWIAGTIICLPVPRRFGTFGQLVTSLVLAGLNFLAVFTFKILPVLGITGYIMVPYLVPEIVLTEYNIERYVPIHLMWSAAPFWESFISLFLQFAFYLQPTLGAIFIWSVGLCIKEEEIAEGGKGLMQLSLGTFFVFFAFHMLSMCGASGVMVIVLRLFYTLWYFFLILFILQYAMLIMKTRAVLYEKIHPKHELIEGEDEKD
ncbi:MAG: hypothetical protein FJ303_08775 [Planctomycetes bacterium]|nr:hypothetical protein [Planctomycetota bacterium]